MTLNDLLNELSHKLGYDVDSNESQPLFDMQLKQLVSEAKQQITFHNKNISLNKCPIYPDIKKLEPRERVRIVFHISKCIVEVIHQIEKEDYNRPHESFLVLDTYSLLLFELSRMRLDFDDDQLRTLLSFFHDSSLGMNRLEFMSWPIGPTVMQFEKRVKKYGVSDEMKDFIKNALTWSEFDGVSNDWESDVREAKQKLRELIHLAEVNSGNPPYFLSEDDVIGQVINDSVALLEVDFREQIYEMFHLTLKASGGKPSKKFSNAAKKIISGEEVARYKTHLHDWFGLLCNATPLETTFDSQGDYTEYMFLSEKNATLIKGLAWTLAQFHDNTTLNLLAKMAERSFRKIPGVGPTCAGVGNACIYSLAHSQGLEGISQLTRLKLRISQNNTKKIIEKYIEEGAKIRGISSAELEELAVPDFGLESGCKEILFAEYTLRLSITGVGKTELVWIKPDGKSQKSVPAFVKKDKEHNEKLKKLKNTAKQIQQYTSAQKDRIDRSYIDNREWSYSDFLKYYLNHGLVSFIAKRLIWIFESGNVRVSAIWKEGNWVDQTGKTLTDIGDLYRVRLWHPLLVNQEEVLQWRNRLETLGIQQPMKQAYREIYILTDAELETRTYSNRMAAHILKQHQFNTLAGIRGWKYSLLGSYDDGRDSETARIPLPAHNIVCEYWINEIYIEDAFNDAGIWNYVSTDQVRFVNESGEAICLAEVPPVIFSEMMRDVDLFVGVGSVGNDPEWLDQGGAPQYRDYWTTYSFGDLTEVAKTRKTVLERLLPRLKIRNKVSIDGKFVRVQGTLREYKIHIGSTNILMEPNDQYLCIVPARGSKTGTDKVFLPFEGDRGLSLVLSKAILLAEDDKITDDTILNQIQHQG